MKLQNLLTGIAILHLCVIHLHLYAQTADSSCTLQFSATTGNVTCPGDNDGSVTINASGGVPPYLYDTGGGRQSSNIFANLIPGTYTVTATDANGYTAVTTATVGITNPGGAPAVSYSMNTTCPVMGNAIQFNGSVSGATSWQWDISPDYYSSIGLSGLTPIVNFGDFGYYCVQLTATNVCGTSVTPPNPVYILENDCPCIVYDYTDIDITGTVPLNNVEKTIKGEIHVKTGAVLDIYNSKLKFGPEGKIVVEAGGTLNATFTTFTKLDSPCDYMWQGIEVWGNPGFNSYSSLQGKAVFQQSTVEHAHIGVLVGAREDGYICDHNLSYAPDGLNLNLSGGVVQIKSDNKFINNGIGVYFVEKPITPSPADLITSSDFYTDQGTQLFDIHYNSLAAAHPYPDYLNPWAGTANAYQRCCKGIDLTAVTKMSIANCNFTRMDTCIKATNTGLRIYSDPGLISYFTEADMGICIQQYVSSLYNRHDIYNCNFDDIARTGIFIRAGKYDRIHDNIFGADHSYFPHLINGIELIKSSNYQVYENELYRCETGIRAINTSIGFIGAKAPDYHGNRFFTCKTAVFTGLDNHALMLRCNRHNPDPNTAWSGQNWRNTGQLADQGIAPYMCGTSPLCPAGNQFYSFNDLYNQIYSNYANDYYYHNNNNNQPTFLIPTDATGNLTNIQGDPNAIWTNQVTNCKPVLTIGPPQNPVLPALSFSSQPFSKIDSLQQLIDSLELVRETIASGLDGGETQLLLDAINSNMPANLLTGMLVSHSPLSDTVLIALITRFPVLAPPKFVLAMMNNVPVSGHVYPWYIERKAGLPKPFRQYLDDLEAAPVAETPALTDNKIEANITLKYDFFSRLVSILCDTLNNREDDALLLLEHEGSVESKKTLAASYLETGDYAQALAKLGEIPQDCENNTDFVNLYTLLVSLYTDSLTIYDMDSAGREYARELAYKCPPSLAVANARTITELLFGERVPECPMEMENKKLQFNNMNMGEYFAQEDEDDAMLGENYPDPFKQKTKIPYSLPEGVTGRIVITDMQGKVIAVYENLNGENELDVDAKDWADGTYIYYLVIGNMVFGSRKMVVD
ncbi:MAG: right-handed parallel beta-helix repeat-containing protein [Bacteroidota bacterium]